MQQPPKAAQCAAPSYHEPAVAPFRPSRFATRPPKTTGTRKGLEEPHQTSTCGKWDASSVTWGAITGPAPGANPERVCQGQASPDKAISAIWWRSPEQCTRQRHVPGRTNHCRSIPVLVALLLRAAPPAGGVGPPVPGGLHLRQVLSETIFSNTPN
jgi:hypothetical protein